MINLIDLFICITNKSIFSNLTLHHIVTKQVNAPNLPLTFTLWLGKDVKLWMKFYYYFFLYILTIIIQPSFFTYNKETSTLFLHKLEAFSCNIYISMETLIQISSGWKLHGYTTIWRITLRMRGLKVLLQDLKVV
jgi:hypothetical protein